MQEKEVKNEILMAIDTDLLNWSGYDSDIKERCRARLAFDLCFLPESERIVAIGALTKAGIFKRSELLGRIKIVKSFLGKRKGKEKKEDKTVKTRTLIPGLIHLVKESEKVGYLLQNSGNFYIEESFTGEDGLNYKPKSDLPIHYCRADILEESREVNYSLLLDNVIKFIKSYLELPKESGYLILGL